MVSLGLEWSVVVVTNCEWLWAEWSTSAMEQDENTGCPVSRQWTCKQTCVVNHTIP